MGIRNAMGMTAGKGGFDLETDMKSDGQSTTKAMGENQTNVRDMVMESYRDMQAGKGRDYKKFFSVMEKRYDDTR